MELPATEFLRRFLLHVVPARFTRIRYYGFLSNRYREQKLARCRQLLRMKAPEDAPAASKPRQDYRDRYEQLTGRSLRECPVCRRGEMVVIETLEGPFQQPAVIDSS